MVTIQIWARRLDSIPRRCSNKQCCELPLWRTTETPGYTMLNHCEADLAAYLSRNLGAQIVDWRK